MNKLVLTPTINSSEDCVLRLVKSLTCDNFFSVEITLAPDQTFLRTEVLIFKDIIKNISESDRKGWALVTESVELNDDGTKFDHDYKSYVQPLDTFDEDKNSSALLDKRIISNRWAKFHFSLKKIDAGNEVELTSLDELKKAFGKYSAIVIKASIW